MTREELIALVGQTAGIADHKANDILFAIEAAGFAIVPVVPSFDTKIAGAGAITADHMAKSANYDAAIDCWSAMIQTAKDEMTNHLE